MGADATETDATVLVVDDERPVLETYEMYLDAEGYDVRTAANGGEALVELDGDVDVVLLDRRMPGMSGDEVLEHITHWEEQCRVVMVTAVDPDPSIVDMGFDDYLTKPIEKDELASTVDQLLLFDRYEALLSEYHSVTNTYATLKAHTELGSTDNEVLEDLEQRREQLLADIRETIAAFDDEDITEVLSEHTPDE